MARAKPEDANFVHPIFPHARDDNHNVLNMSSGYQKWPRLQKRKCGIAG
jgi:hypothetical protein